MWTSSALFTPLPLPAPPPTVPPHPTLPPLTCLHFDAATDAAVCIFVNPDPAASILDSADIFANSAISIFCSADASALPGAHNQKCLHHNQIFLHHQDIQFSIDVDYCRKFLFICSNLNNNYIIKCYPRVPPSSYLFKH